MPGSGPSSRFLFDDSFLHDAVTRSELARHRYAIQLNPGAAQGLASQAERLDRVIKNIWVDDVLRINKMASDQRTRLGQHLFGHAIEPFPPARMPAAPTEHPSNVHSTTQPDQNFSSLLFATRLNRLIATMPDYSSGEVAAQIRQSGFPMTVSTLTQLQAGVGPAPSLQTIKALANHFGVDPTYFFGETTSTDAGTQCPASVASRMPPQLSSTTSPGDGADDTLRTDTTGGPRGEEEDGFWGQVFDADLGAIAAACEIRDNGCWIRPSNTQVRCRPPGDPRKPVDLPKLGLHRWSWMVANGYSNIAIPSYLIHIRRTCIGWTCCNPQHLFATSRSGVPLSQAAIAALVRELPGPSTKAIEVVTNSIHSHAARPGRLVLQADLASIRNCCSIDQSGCWIPSSAGPMACRADGDERADDDLPLMAPHRWVWMVTHGRASDPLPGSFHVRRRCGNPSCCRPEHLYLTTTQGRELTLEVAESLLNLQRRQGHTGLESGGRHRKLEDGDPLRIANAADGMAHFAARLNQLFEASTLPDGVPRTSRGVAAALQEEGLPVSESLIDRLRSGQGNAPSIRTVEALAYLFNVDAGYFGERGNSSIDDHDSAADAPSTPSTSSATPQTTYDDQNVAISVDEIGQVVTGLSEAISHCLASEPTRTQTATRLAKVLADVGAVLSEGDLIIDRSSLRRIVDEWNRLAQGSKHREIRARLSYLANTEYLR